MRARNAIIAVVAIAALAAAGWYGLRRLKCADRVGSFYPTQAQAVAAGAVARGWIPRTLPAEATDIHEEHNLDTNEIWMRFTVSPDRARQFAGSLRLLSQKEVAGLAIRPPCDRSWWFEGLVQEQPANDAALNADVYGASLNARGQLVVAIDRASPTVYYWSSR